MAAAKVQSRKRCASPFLDEAFPAPPHLAKRGCLSPCAGAATQQQPPPLASLISRAAARADGGGMDECAGVLVEQMAAATDLKDAKNRASWILALVKDAVAERAAAALRASSRRGVVDGGGGAQPLKEENASLRAQAAAEAARLWEENASLRVQAAEEASRLREENATLRAQAAAEAARLREENAVLKRGVALLHARMEEARKKVAELEMANYALGVRLRDADACRFQVFRGHDAF